MSKEQPNATDIKSFDELRSLVETLNDGLLPVEYFNDFRRRPPLAQFNAHNGYWTVEKDVRLAVGPLKEFALNALMLNMHTPIALRRFCDLTFGTEAEMTIRRTSKVLMSLMEATKEVTGQEVIRRDKSRGLNGVTYCFGAIELTQAEPSTNERFGEMSEARRQHFITQVRTLLSQQWVTLPKPTDA